MVSKLGDHEGTQVLESSIRYKRDGLTGQDLNKQVILFSSQAVECWSFRKVPQTYFVLPS